MNEKNYENSSDFLRYGKNLNESTHLGICLMRTVSKMVSYKIVPSKFSQISNFQN